MATFSGSAGVVKAGGKANGEIRSFSVEQSGDVIEDTKMGDSAKKIFIRGIELLLSWFNLLK